MLKDKHNLGYTLIELMIVIGILGVVSVIAVSFLITSLVSTSKSEALKETRQNGEYALGVIKGMMVSSKKITSLCPEIAISPAPQSISFIASDGSANTFACLFDDATYTTGHLALNSDRLTSHKVDVINSSCEISCTQQPGSSPSIHIYYQVGISKQADLKVAERSTLTFDTIVKTYNY